MQQQVKPRNATLPMRKGPKSNKKRVLHFQVDDDEAQGLMEDAVFGPVRRGEGYHKDTLTRPQITDVQVAATRVAEATYRNALGQGATSVLPPSWTQGYALPSERLDFAVGGQAPDEGQWDLDPAAVTIIDAAYHRTVEQARAHKRTSGEAALMEAYSRSARFMAGMLKAAKERRYNFTPKNRREESELSNFPWARSVYYELAVRGLDGLWTALDITRDGGMEETLGAIVRANLNTVFNDFYARIAKCPDAKLSVNFMETINNLDTVIERTVTIASRARTHAARLIMLGSSLDAASVAGPWRQRVTYIPGRRQPLILESLFFGRQHITLETMLHLSPALESLRYFSNSSRVFQRDPMFAYTLDRVLIPGQEEDTPVGLRITLPPAPQGYRRRNVLVQFVATRTVVATKGSGGGSEMAESLDAVVAVTVPDNGVYHLGSEEDASFVDQLPASIVLFLSKQDFETRGETVLPSRPPELPSDLKDTRQLPNSASPVFLQPAVGVFNTNTGTEAGEPRLAWQAVYDMAWLEWVSGDAGRLHPVNNRRFYDRLNDLYFRPWAASEGGRDGRGQAPQMAHIQITVELQAAPGTLSDARANRRSYSQRRFPGTRWTFPFTSNVPDAAVQRRFDLRFDNDSEQVRAQLDVASMEPLAQVDTPTLEDEILFRTAVEDLAPEDLLLQELAEADQGRQQEPPTESGTALSSFPQGSDLREATTVPSSAVPDNNNNNNKPQVLEGDEPIDLGFESEIGAEPPSSKPQTRSPAPVDVAEAGEEISLVDDDYDMNNSEVVEDDAGLISASE